MAVRSMQGQNRVVRNTQGEGGVTLIHVCSNTEAADNNHAFELDTLDLHWCLVGKPTRL